MINFFIRAGLNLHEIIKLRRYHKAVKLRYYSIYRKTKGLPSSLSREIDNLNREIRMLSIELQTLKVLKESKPEPIKIEEPIDYDIKYVKYISDDKSRYFTKGKIYKVVDSTKYNPSRHLYLEILDNDGARFNLNWYNTDGKKSNAAKKFVKATESGYYRQYNSIANYNILNSTINNTKKNLLKEYCDYLRERNFYVQITNIDNLNKARTITMIYKSIKSSKTISDQLSDSDIIKVLDQLKQYVIKEELNCYK